MKSWIRAFLAVSTAAFVVATLSPAAHATWSIIIVDTKTKEVAIGSATCLANFDLRQWLPVVQVEVGAAAAQSSIDSTGANRRLIWDELQKGTHPLDIRALLRQQDSAHQSRQYGIVDVRGQAMTFSGRANGAFANGLIGQIGDLVYAIQGNVLTGQPVIDDAEQAVRNTPGGLPEKLIAAMEAARSDGGDGRCSCSPADPTGCGSPPDSFVRAAFVGFIIDARRGDIDGVCDNADGCASGIYYLNKNFKNGNNSKPDPVIVLRTRFDTWRTNLVGVPDQIESLVTVTPDRSFNDGLTTATVTIEVRDWQGVPATNVLNVEVLHDPRGSAGSSTIGPTQLIDAANQVWQAQLTVGTTAGLDQLAVRVTSDRGPRFLMPGGRLAVQDQRADLNNDGVVDLTDLNILLGSFGGGSAGDVDGDSDTDLTDLALLLTVAGLGN